MIIKHELVWPVKDWTVKDLNMFVCRLSSDLTDFIETEDLDTFRLHDLEHTSVSVKTASCVCRSGFVLFHAVAVKDEGHCSFSKGIVITVLGSSVVALSSPQRFSTSQMSAYLCCWICQCKQVLMDCIFQIRMGLNLVLELPIGMTVKWWHPFRVITSFELP